MTSDSHDYEGIIRNAVARAASAHVFFEERADLRMTLGSSGLREIIETRTRGAAISGQRSVHVAGREFMDLPRMDPKQPFPRAPLLEAAIIEGATQASAGRRHPLWSAKLISFHQEVWVGLSGTEAAHDVRRGSRVTLRVQMKRALCPCGRRVGLAARRVSVAQGGFRPSF